MPGPITVIAKLRAAEGKEALLQALLIEQVAAVHKAEPGCMSYKLHVDAVDPSLFCFYEQYVDAAAKAAHQSGEHMRAFRERRAALGLVEGAVDVQVFLPLTD